MTKVWGLIFFLSGFSAIGQDNGMCERNSRTHRYDSPFINYLTNQLAQSSDPILQLYRQPAAVPQPVTGLGRQVERLSDVMNSVVNTDHFPKTCINASMLTRSSAKSFACAGPGDPQINFSPENEAACVAQEQVDYTHWLVNRVYNCFNDPANPLDPRLVFLKINNESGFDHTVCSGAGCGLGQLTPPAVAQMGRLDGVESFVPNAPVKEGCEAFKNLIYPESRRLNSYSGYEDSSRGEMCKLLSPGKGAALNAMYSLGYLKYLTRRNGELKEALALIDTARADSDANLLRMTANFETAQAAFNLQATATTRENLRIARNRLTAAQNRDGELADARWEQYLLMAAYNQGSGRSSAAMVNGKYEPNGVYRSLERTLRLAGQDLNPKPIQRYMTAVGGFLDQVSPSGQDPYTEEVFQNKRQQVLSMASSHGLGSCSLAQDYVAPVIQRAIPLQPITSSDLPLRGEDNSSARTPAAVSPATSGRN